MSTKKRVSPIIVVYPYKVCRPYEGGERYLVDKIEHVNTRVDVLLQDLETTLGVKVCVPGHKSECFRLLVRTMDGETTYVSMRPGTYRRSDWGDGLSSSFEVAWDLLRAYGYRGRTITNRAAAVVPCESL